MNRRIILTVLLASAAVAPAARAQTWSEYVLTAPPAGTSAIAVAVAGQLTSYYVTYEVEEAATSTHTLYLQRWPTPWAAPVVIASHVGAWIYNPTITVRSGHVTIAGHQAAAAGCAVAEGGLREYDYDLVTGVVDSSRVIDAAATCDEVGHSHLVYSPDDTTYHVCWTRKTAATGDEIECATRSTAAAAWTVADNVSAGAANNQDHATVAVKSGTNNTRRVVFHDQTANLVDDDHEARLFMTKPAGTVIEYRIPDMLPVPQAGWQDRPFIALDGDSKMHVTWEDGPDGGEGIKYVRCLNATPEGCDHDLEWEWNNVILSQAGIQRARYPHLKITANRTWISYEQRWSGPPAYNEVMTIHRCLTAPFTQAWTLSDPFPADTTTELTEEYGTPHIASRLAPAFPAGGFATEVGTVALRMNAATGSLDAVLYKASEPACP